MLQILFLVFVQRPKPNCIAVKWHPKRFHNNYQHLIL